MSRAAKCLWRQQRMSTHRLDDDQKVTSDEGQPAVKLKVV